MIPFIFIHIGNTFPNYVKTSLEQCHKWNTNCTIYFICSNLHKDVIQQPYVQVVFLEDIQLTEKHDIFNKISGLDMGFRDGFWKYTTERLFVLEDFCIQNNIYECFHIENDNMVYFSASDLLDTFRKSVNGISSPALAHDENTFGILYCNNINILGELTLTLLYNPTNQNEMGLGSTFFHNHVNNTSFLPSIPLTDSTLSDVDKKYIANNIDIFNGIFDPAQYGQWLGGVDPRNFESGPFQFSNTRAKIQANTFNYTIVEEINGLKRYYICDESKNINLPIYILHIHSKFCDKFLLN